MLRIFQVQKVNITISWGSVVWSSLDPQALNYDSIAGLSDGICVTSRKICTTSQTNAHTNLCNDQKELWSLLSSCTVWHIWKARCARVIGQLVIPAAQVVQNIWQEMVTTLRARYDNIKGNLDSIVRKRMVFHAIWKQKPFYELCGYGPKWLYNPPKWLFPPPIT